MNKNIPINKGNYSLDTLEREEHFFKKRAIGFEEEFFKHRKEWEVLPKTFSIAEYPLLVDIELSSLCNLKCPFCYTITPEFKKVVNTKLMDFELFKKIIDEISEHVFAIRLSLRGEPTLHPKFIDAIKYAKSKGIREVSTLTNGSKLTPDYFEKVMLAGIDWITISFDGLYGEYEKNRYPLKFDEMYSRLKSIKQIKEKNNSQKPVIKLQTVWPAIAKKPSEYYDALVGVSDLLAFNPLIDYSHPMTADKIKYEENFACPMLYQRLVIGADGLVLLCANDEENEYVLGNVYKESIKSIWHGEKLNSMRELHKTKDGFKKISVCRKCYLPRMTTEESHEVNGMVIIVKNYITESN